MQAANTLNDQFNLSTIPGLVARVKEKLQTSATFEAVATQLDLYTSELMEAASSKGIRQKAAFERYCAEFIYTKLK